MRMPFLCLVLSLFVCGLTLPTTAAETTLKPAVVKSIHSGKHLLVSVDEAAKAFGWEGKVVTPGKLLTLCRGTICIPLRLDQVKHEKKAGRLYVEAQALASALGTSVEETGKPGEALLKPTKAAGEETSPPAYHADFGPGRGFQKGQTVPDIPLYDLNGKEVRFSDFLGKRYLLYIWASW